MEEELSLQEDDADKAVAEVSYCELSSTGTPIRLKLTGIYPLRMEKVLSDPHFRSLRSISYILGIFRWSSSLSSKAGIVHFFRALSPT